MPRGSSFLQRSFGLKLRPRIQQPCRGRSDDCDYSFAFAHDIPLGDGRPHGCSYDRRGDFEQIANLRLTIRIYGHLKRSLCDCRQIYSYGVRAKTDIRKHGHKRDPDAGQKKRSL
jgi:hypothetical protein